MNLQAWHTGVVGGDLAAFRRLNDEALTILTRHPDERVEAHVRSSLSELAEWTGDYRGAIELAEGVIATARRLRLAHLIVWPQWFMGKASCCLGDYGRALARLQDAYDMCDRIGDRAWKGRLLNTLGWCCAEIGSHELAREYNERAAAMGREAGDMEILANSEINLAGNHLALGDAGRAREHLAPILEQLARPGDPWMRWRYALHADDTLAHLERARGEPEQALALADQELAGARRHGIRKVEARALLLRGGALCDLDRRDEADAALGDALDVARAIEYPRAIWRCHDSLAEVARRRGRRDAAARHAEEARALRERLAASLAREDLRAALRAGR
jgi:tetratricopeptide (TPR) repeat protein